MLLDANLLIYSVDTRSAHHVPANDWLHDVLNGEQRVAIPWQTIGAFLRITTNPRINDSPLSAGAAWDYVAGWLATDVTWIPAASDRTASILGDLVSRHEITSNLVTDAQLAALAIEHGQVVMTADTDFARFPEVRWENPLRQR